MKLKIMGLACLFLTQVNTWLSFKFFNLMSLAHYIKIGRCRGIVLCKDCSLRFVCKLDNVKSTTQMDLDFDKAHPGMLKEAP